MRIGMILPGGVGQDGLRVIPALCDLIERLARRHELLVLALDQEQRPTSYSLRGARICCLGREPGWPGRRLSRALAALRPLRPQVLHSFWLGATSTLGLLLGRALGAPLLASLGGGELVGLPQIGYGGQLRRRARLHARLAMAGAAALTAGSRYSLAPLAARRSDAIWAPLGAAPAPASGPRPGPPWRLLHVASINLVKGPLLLLEALAAARRRGAPPFTLDWLGEDTLGGLAQGRAAELGLGELVRFHGLRPHDEVLAGCQTAHLYLQASLHESQGVAVCEAAMAGVPTLGSAVGLVAELAPTAALATPPGDAEALGQALAELLGDPARRTSLGRASRAWAAAHDADWTAATFDTLYGRLAAT